MVHHIQKIVDKQPYKLLLEFNTGETLWVDLESTLKRKSTHEKSIFRPLLNPEYFNNVKYNEEIRCIYWGNGVDFCPDVLYMMAKNIPFKHNDEA